MIDRSALDAAIVAAPAALAASTILMAVTVEKPFEGRELPGARWIWLSAIAAVAGTAGYDVTGDLFGATATAALLLCGYLFGALRFRNLSAPGIAVSLTPVIGAFAALPWGYLLLDEAGYPNWSLNTYLIGSLIGILFMPYALLVGIAQTSLFTHRSWRRIHRPAQPVDALENREFPFVSIHVPCYAEPPEVVIRTLRALSNLDYPHYEVIVCDNNTEDPSLWQPLKRWCEGANERLQQDRFRFFHVAPLDGAKAGALNFCLAQTAEVACLVSVLDADYEAKPDFLSRFVDYFCDDRVGFVQTSHDYRDCNESLFKAACYWEYMPTYKVGYPCINEYDGAFTIGTMCILRRNVLEKIGGWAEWCLTEDCEIAWRIRAAGYEGVYVRDTFGHGLIPDNFGDYKKQRFRWTAGPGQQLRRHWRLLTPKRLKLSKSKASGWSKLLAFHHCLEIVQFALAPVLMIGLSAILFLIGRDALPTIYLPSAAWIALALAVFAQSLRLWMRYRLAGDGSLRSVVLGVFASRALSFVRMHAACAGLFSARPLAWRRTPKFKSNGRSLILGVTDALPEFVIGLLCLAASMATALHTVALGSHVAWLAAAVWLLAGISYLCAPLLGVLAESELQTAIDEPPSASFETKS